MHQRLQKMQHLGHHNQVQISLDLLCLVYAYAERYPEAISLLNTHPEMGRTPWTAQAHAGAGAFAEVMQYLPQMTVDQLAMTVDQLATNLLWVRPSCLIAWVLLLGGNCELTRADDSSTNHMLSSEERQALAFELLSALRSY